MLVVVVNTTRLHKYRERGDAMLLLRYNTNISGGSPAIMMMMMMRRQLGDFYVAQHSAEAGCGGV